MPVNHRIALGAGLAWKMVLTDRVNILIFAFLPLLCGFLWHRDSFDTAAGFLVLLFPYVFLFLVRDMMRSDIDSGALENSLFIDDRLASPAACGGEPGVGGSRRVCPLGRSAGFMPRARKGGRERSDRWMGETRSGFTLQMEGGFRDVLWIRFLFVVAVGILYVLLLLVLCAVAGLVSGRSIPFSPLQFFAGITAGVFYAGWGGFLGFFLKAGSNVLSVLLLQAGLGVTLLMTLGRQMEFFSMLEKGVFPDSGSLVKFLAFLAAFPNILVRKSLNAYIPFIGVLAAAAWILVRIASARAEMKR